MKKLDKTCRDTFAILEKRKKAITLLFDSRSFTTFVAIYVDTISIAILACDGRKIYFAKDSNASYEKRLQ